jgi:hypothetical protein
VVQCYEEEDKTSRSQATKTEKKTGKRKTGKQENSSDLEIQNRECLKLKNTPHPHHTDHIKHQAQIQNTKAT